MTSIDNNKASQISVCLATFKRNVRLRAVLQDIAQQDLLPDQVVVVDNDASGGARSVVEDFRRVAPFPVEYDVQPIPNIALTRNRTVALATGDWIAFIDDDERAPKEWLRLLMEAVKEHKADAVLAPVQPQVPADAPAWIRRGTFYDFPHQPDGAEVPLNCMRFGNVVVRADLVRAEREPFDPSFGLSTGEDADFLVRLVHKGARVIWSEKAPVSEPVESKRLSLRYLMMRALGDGQGFARYTLSGNYGPINTLGRGRFICRALLQMLAAAAIAIVSIPFGLHHAAAWLVRASANFGKLSALWGWAYPLYARSSSSRATE
jgi:succinoglycan biosynthesis protein ExoM